MAELTPVSLSDQLQRRPVNRDAVDSLKAEMLLDVESYRLHTLEDVAEEFGISLEELRDEG
jgi:hypothetical protein